MLLPSPSRRRLTRHSLWLLLVLAFVALGRVVSPVGGSLLAAQSEGPLLLADSLCLSMPADGPVMNAVTPLPSDPVGAGGAHDCCWWMCGTSLLAVLLVVAGLPLLGLRPPSGQPEPHSAPIPLLWRFDHPVRGPPAGFPTHAFL